MTFLTKLSEKPKDSYKVLDLPDSDVLQRQQQSRRRTDKFFLFVFAASIVIFLPFLIYTLSYSDINRLRGYDRCGNICGQKNAKYDQWDCTGQDMTWKPRINYDRECLDSNDYGTYESFRQRMFNLMYTDVWKVALLSFVPIALSLIFVVLFRYHPAVAVWSILVGSWLIVTTAGVFALYFNAPYYERDGTYVPIIICCTISLLMLCTYIFAYFNHIRLSTALLKEATRPLFEIKMMSYVPSAALCSLIAVILLHSVVSFQIATYGKLTEIDGGYTGDSDDVSVTLQYVSDNLMPATMIVSFLIALWAILFVLGAQYTTVSGAVAQWYTANDQDDSNEFVRSNLLATVKYHMGTVALGSVMMTIMFIPRSILQFFTIFSALKQKADSWLRYLDGFFTNNSYIITAMYGTPFFQSGKRAANLLNLSIGDTRDLNKFTNYVIQIAQTLIVVASTLPAFVILQDNPLYGCYFTLIECAIACICVHTILGTLKVSTNTLFLCATEELLGDKETDLPFTKTMKEAVDGSNKLLLQKVQSRPPSNIPEKSFCIKMFLFIFVVVSCVLFVVACFI